MEKGEGSWEYLIVAIIVILVGYNLVADNYSGSGTPIGEATSSLGLPDQAACNYNGICEYEDFEDDTCADCQTQIQEEANCNFNGKCEYALGEDATCGDCPVPDEFIEGPDPGKPKVPKHPNLIAHFSFDNDKNDKIKDSSKVKNHGANFGATYTEGKFGKALQFDGVDDYLSIPDHIAYTLSQEKGETFSIVLLPDTQHYSIYYRGFRNCFHQKFPNIYKAQTKWIKQNKDAYNIKFVLHLGDIVQQGDDPQEYEWKTAVNAMKVLEKNNIPYGVIPGNHDYADGCRSDNQTKTSKNYNAYFGIRKFKALSRKWENLPYEAVYGGNFDGGIKTLQYPNKNLGNENNYFLLSPYHDQKFLLIGLEFCPSIQALEWAQGLIDQYPERKVILFTHSFLARHEDLSGDSVCEDEETGVVCCRPGETCVGGREIRKNLLSNSNIVAVVNGHHTKVQQSAYLSYPSNQPFTSIIRNYQGTGWSESGDGWLDLMIINPSANSLEIKSIKTIEKPDDWDCNSEEPLQPLYELETFPYRSNAVTISLWFKTNTIKDQILVGKGFESHDMSFLLSLNAQEEITFNVYTDNYYENLVGSFPYADNQWHHLVVSYNNQEMKLYVDRNLIKSKKAKRIILDSFEPIMVGGIFTLQEVANLFEGAIDDVRIYNKALTPDEIYG